MAAPGEPPSEGLRLLGHVDRDDRRHERRDERDDDRQNVFRSSELFFVPKMPTAARAMNKMKRATKTAMRIARPSLPLLLECECFIVMFPY